MYKWVPVTYCWWVTLWLSYPGGSSDTPTKVLHANETRIGSSCLGLWLMCTFSFYLYIHRSRGYFAKHWRALNAKWFWSLAIRVRKQYESGSTEGPINNNLYLLTLLVFPGISKFFIRSPGLPGWAPNLLGNTYSCTVAIFKMFSLISSFFKVSKEKIENKTRSSF